MPAARRAAAEGEAAEGALPGRWREGAPTMYARRGWVEGSSINSGAFPLLGSSPRNFVSAPNPFFLQLNLDSESKLFSKIDNYLSSSHPQAATRPLQCQTLLSIKRGGCRGRLSRSAVNGLPSSTIIG